MKPAAFEYERAYTVDEALVLLSQSTDARLLAGGQTLGPMLNLRLVQPQLLVDITRIKALVRSEINANTVTLGACVSHAAIEDARMSDATHGYLPRVASGIAYRAVRNRGTIGGSLANADPTADSLLIGMTYHKFIKTARAQYIFNNPSAPINFFCSNSGLIQRETQGSPGLR